MKLGKDYSFYCISSALAVLALSVIAISVLWSYFGLLELISPLHYQLALYKDGKGVRRVVFGDSHAGMGYAPDVDEFVLAIPGESISETRLKVDYLLANRHLPKTVLLQAQPHMFFGHRDHSPRPAYLSLRKRSGILDRIAPMGSPWDACCRAKALGQLYSQLRNIPRDNGVPEIGARGQTRFPNLQPVPDTQFKILVRQEISGFGDNVPRERLKDFYADTILKLEEAGHHVVLIKFPLHSEYLAGFEAGALSEVNGFFSELTRGRGIKICGSWRWEMAEFHNPDHLTSHSAMQYRVEVLGPCLQKSIAQ